MAEALTIRGHVRIFEELPDGSRTLITAGDNMITRRGRQYLISAGLTGGVGAPASAYDSGVTTNTAAPFQWFIISPDTSAPAVAEDATPGAGLFTFNSGSGATTWNQENVADTSTGKQTRRTTITVSAGSATGTWGSVAWTALNTGAQEGARFLLASPYTKAAGTTTTVVYEISVS